MCGPRCGPPGGLQRLRSGYVVLYSEEGSDPMASGNEFGSEGTERPGQVPPEDEKQKEEGRQGQEEDREGIGPDADEDEILSGEG
jgi:hypothetical protein